jgi:hypothetical protein
VHRFLFGGGCAASEDAALRERCRRVRRLHVASYALAAVALLVATLLRA